MSSMIKEKQYNDLKRVAFWKTFIIMVAIFSKSFFFFEKKKKKKEQDVFVKHEHVPGPRSIFL